MAEIHIEQHEHNVWPWIFGLLALALLAWWLLSMRTNGNENTVAVATVGGAVVDSVPEPREAAPIAVNDFLSDIEEHRAAASADSTHNYEAEGVRRLAAALDALAGRDSSGAVLLDAQIEGLRNRADALQRNRRSTEHARHTREAFGSAAALTRTSTT